MFQDHFVDIPDPMLELQWEDHEKMMAFIFERMNKWSTLVETDDNCYEYVPDKIIQKKLCNKLRYLAKLCQIRICNIMEQIQSDKMRSVLEAYNRFNVKSDKWVSKKEKQLRIKREQLLSKLKVKFFNNGPCNNRHNEILRKEIETMKKELKQNREQQIQKQRYLENKELTLICQFERIKDPVIIDTNM